jgi:hypothetical protein
VMERVRVFWEGEGLAPVPPPARDTARRFERDPVGVGPATAPVAPAAPATRDSGTAVS